MTQASPEIDTPRAGGEPEIVTRARAGDREAFAALYNEHYDAVFLYLYRRTWANRELTEDLASETFVRALRYFDRFSWQGKNVRAWLTTIARNLFADYCKSACNRCEWPTALIADSDQDLERLERSSEEEVLEVVVNQALYAAIRRLGAAQRQVIICRFFLGYSIAETAVAMGKRQGAIKTLTFRAVQSLAATVPPEMAPSQMAVSA